ncbi:probable transposase (partial length) [Desulfotalea psychrophila LSv54]|uniref:Probable transposase (Partial length) n=1 Tax=Desulfotalea psychrophila (strain LSv54 / DSM 12343) TaxID=177439 RepID=Q6AID2_DESPS|nr:probable transposase (partial length) [Desulfotalea psychrophila LSv54]
MDIDLQAPDYTSASRRAQTVKVNYRLPSRGPIKHIVIDSTGLKVYGEGEWRVRKHGAGKRRTWRKLHLAIDTETHQIISGEISMEWVHDSKVLGPLLNPLRRRIEQISGDGAGYERVLCRGREKRCYCNYSTTEKCCYVGGRPSKK